MSFIFNPAKESLMTREQLISLPTPAPIGKFHSPLNYGEFVDMIDDKLEGHEIQVVNEQFAVKHDHSQFFGLLEVVTPQHTDRDWSLKIGIRGSHDGSISRGITFGSNVLVCSNLCFHGELGLFKTRQTLNIRDRLPALIDAAIAQIPVAEESNLVRFDKYRTTKISESEGSNMLIYMHRKGLLNASQLSTAAMEWIEPRHEEHNEDGATIWRLFNATTEAIKPNNDRGSMNTIQSRSMEISNHMDKVIEHIAA